MRCTTRLAAACSLQHAGLGDPAYYDNAAVTPCSCIICAGALQAATQLTTSPAHSAATTALLHACRHFAALHATASDVLASCKQNRSSPHAPACIAATTALLHLPEVCGCQNRTANLKLCQQRLDAAHAAISSSPATHGRCCRLLLLLWLI